MQLYSDTLQKTVKLRCSSCLNRAAYIQPLQGILDNLRITTAAGLPKSFKLISVHVGSK